MSEIGRIVEIERNDPLITNVLDYAEIMKAESHHNHPIIVDHNGTIRWRATGIINHLLDTKLNLNDLVALFYELGWDKNSEQYRHLYRSMGYSLAGYWEVFYWEMNNEDADKYVGGKS